MVKEMYACAIDNNKYKAKRKLVVYRWMICLGFNHNTCHKGYCVDGHEITAIIGNYDKFAERYLQREQRMSRWVQITKKRNY